MLYCRRATTTFVAHIAYLGGKVSRVHKTCTCKGVAPVSYKTEVTKVIHMFKTGGAYPVAEEGRINDGSYIIQLIQNPGKS